MSSRLVAVGGPKGTACPAVGVAGGVAPWARRTTTSARSASVGLVHDKCTNVSPRAVTARSVTGPGAVLSDTASVRVVTVVPVGVVLPLVSRVNTAYEYWVSALSPVSVTDVAFADPSVTAVPAVADPGALAPRARRTMIRARSASVGLLHDSTTLLVVRVSTVNPPTGPGGVVSAGGVGGVTTGGAVVGGAVVGGVTGADDDGVGVGTLGLTGKTTRAFAVLPALTVTLPGVTDAPGARTL